MNLQAQFLQRLCIGGFRSVGAWLEIWLLCTMQHGLCIDGVKLYALCIMAKMIRMGVKLLTGQSVCQRNWRPDKMFSFRPNVGTVNRSDKRRSDFRKIIFCNLIGWWQQICFLQSWEKTAQLNTLTACAHAQLPGWEKRACEPACRRGCADTLLLLLLLLQLNTQITCLGQSVVSASDSLAPLNASFDNSSCVPW